MKLNYFFGHGCHNEFILFDLIKEDLQVVDIYDYVLNKLRETKKDDALIITKVFDEQSDTTYQMLVLEPDGSFADFCGNGARVVGSYLNKIKSHDQPCYLQTRAGKLKVFANEENYIGIEMPKTVFTIHGSKFIDKGYVLQNSNFLQLKYNNTFYKFYFTETLEPHLITFDNICIQELIDIGEHYNIRDRTLFPLGVNLNICKINNEKELSLITFERGVNKVTQACGTAATSAAQLYCKMQNKAAKISVIVPGGKIDIDCLQNPVIMWGNAFINLS